MNFSEKLDLIQPMEGSLVLFWLGQAGFLIKTAGGKIIVIDPYLTDSVYEKTKADRGFGFKRLAAPLFGPDEIEIDFLFISHEHGDHLDTGVLPVILKNKKTRCFTNAPGINVIKKEHIPVSGVKEIKTGDQIDFGEWTLKVVDCDHGELSPEAVGFVFDFGFIKIYYSGDTVYNPELIDSVLQMQPEIALLPCNGAFGNLNAAEAARLANMLKCRICIPHHFWTFPLHKGDPMELIEVFPKEAPSCRLVLLTPGEPYTAGAENG